MAVSDVIGLTQKDPQTRGIVQNAVGNAPAGASAGAPQAVEGVGAVPTEQAQDIENGASQQPDQASANVPKKQATMGDIISSLPPAVAGEVNNPDLPYAKAAAWNAFFGSILRKAGGASGGVPDAIAAYSNTYGRSLQKMSDMEAEYNAQRAIVNKAAKDTIGDEIGRFESGDPFTDAVVKNSGGDVKRIKALAQAARANGSEQAASLEDLVEKIDNIELQRRDNLLQSANYGGKVKNTENGEINGQPVTKIVTESGKVRFVDAAGKTITDPKGFKSEKQLEGELNRNAKAIEGEENRALRGQIAQGQQAISGMVASLQRDKFEEENKIGPLKGGGYRSPDGIVYTGAEMGKYRATTQQLASNLPRLESLTEQDFKDAKSAIDWTAQPHLARTASEQKTLIAQTKIKEAQVQQTLQNLPPGPASDKDILQASSAFPGFSNAGALKAWKDRSVKGAKKGIELMNEQFPGGVYVPKGVTGPAPGTGSTVTVGGKKITVTEE